MRVIRKTYNWAHPLVHRSGSPPLIVYHHAAAKACGPADVHRWHINLGYSGIGYHYFVQKSGRITKGRPDWAMGAHARGGNDSIGICAEGNYDAEKAMPAKQLAALRWLHDRLRAKYPHAEHIRHRDVVGSATACPGKHYPFRAILEGVPDEREPIKLTSHHVSVPRMNKVKAGWRTVGLKGWAERLRKQGDGDRIVVYADHVILPVPKTLPWWWEEMLEWRKGRTIIVVSRKKPPFWWHRLKP